MFKVGDVVKLKQEVIAHDSADLGWIECYKYMLKGYHGIVSTIDDGDCVSVKVGGEKCYGISMEGIELVKAIDEQVVETTCQANVKLERVGERVILEINGKLSKETIEKILNLVW